MARPGFVLGLVPGLLGVGAVALTDSVVVAMVVFGVAIVATRHPAVHRALRRVRDRGA
jgi:threonine/homoserine/homoserine lactone efflux protein